MKTLKYISLCLFINFCLVANIAQAQSPVEPIKKEEKIDKNSSKSPSADQLEKDANESASGLEKNGEEVMTDSKQSSKSKDALSWLKKLKIRDDALNKKIINYETTVNDSTSKSKVLKLLNILLLAHQDAAKEVEKAGKANINFTAADKTILEKYKKDYVYRISKIKEKIEYEKE